MSRYIFKAIGNGKELNEYVDTPFPCSKEQVLRACEQRLSSHFSDWKIISLDLFIDYLFSEDTQKFLKEG